jgi:riboflavin synthase
MFTGIIKEIGTIRQLNRSTAPATIAIESLDLFDKVSVSDSMAVNGVCLTVVKKNRGLLYFEAVDPTLKSTNLKRLKTRDTVNLETALKTGDTLGGHFVLGHVDRELRLKRVSARGGYHNFQIELPAEYAKYTVEKGSLAVEGVSLTVKTIIAGSFTVDIIPFTFDHTTLKNKRPGDWLNIEFDYLLKKK